MGECVSGVCANLEPRDHCFGGFRHWRITLRSLGTCAAKRFGGYSCGGTTGLLRGAPLNKRFVRKIEKNVLLDIYRAGQGGSCDEGNGSSCERGLEDYSALYWILRERM